MTEATLVFFFRGREVLLAMKKRGHGVGFWNAPGGKVNPGETAVDAAIRETMEEVGVRPNVDKPIGVAEYIGSQGDSWLVHIFRTEKFTGDPKETEEMKPQWFGIEAIPYQTMRLHDRAWMPYVIHNKPFRATFWFDDSHRMIRQNVTAL